MISQASTSGAWAPLLACGLSLAVATLLVLTKHWHGRLTLDSHSGVQKFHTEATPRVGGLPVLVGVLGTWALLPLDAQLLLAPLLLAAIPAFGSGFIEDITKRVSVRTRLLCTIGSGMLACLLTGYSVRETGIWGLDWLLGYTVFSVLFTALAIGTMANAVNMIDGFNGLSAGSLVIMLGGMAAIASGVGDPALALLSLVLAGALLGFAMLNWPLGKIFLGDGGAYFAGFTTAWIGVLLVGRNPGEVSAWAPLTVCAYPLLEVFFSILRRRLRKHSPGDADRLHLHSLVRRRVVAFWLPQASPLGQNSVTGLLMWPASVGPCIWALLFAQDGQMLAAGIAVWALAYWWVYRALIGFQWGTRRVNRR